MDVVDVVDASVPPDADAHPGLVPRSAEDAALDVRTTGRRCVPRALRVMERLVAFVEEAVDDVAAGGVADLLEIVEAGALPLLSLPPCGTCMPPTWRPRVP